MTDDQTAIEAQMREACAAGEYERAATWIIERYGAELMSFLQGQLRSTGDADDAFASFSEQLWKALPSFEWRSSARTWAYKLARHIVYNQRRYLHRHGGGGRVGLSALSQLSAAVDRVRSATAAHQRTAVKSRLQTLREQLPPDDQAVLVLRVDRGLSWLELAEVMLDEGSEPTPEALKKEAARLRKRFQLAKDRLRALVEEAGLLEES